MNGPSARALREGGIGGSIPYKIGVTLVVKLQSGGPLPPEWRKKTVLQEPFGDYGQVLRIDTQEAQGIAFIEYEDKRDAEDAEREMNGKQILGKTLNVTLARAPDQRRGFGPGRTVDIEERIAELARRHRLDEAATARLASVFHDRARLGCDLNRDFEELNEHLAASNKPSALVSMKLADLRAGRSIGPCKYAGGGRRGTGMCEVDEPYHMGNGYDARSQGDSHGRDEGRAREDGRSREHRDRRPRSRERDRERDRDRDRDRVQSGRTEEKAPQRRREEASPKRAHEGARSASHQPEKSRRQKASPKPSREVPGGDGRQHEKPREHRQSPRRGKEHCRSDSSEAGKKKDHDRAKSRSRQKEKKPRDAKVSIEHRGQLDSGLLKERAQSSDSSCSRLRKKKPKGGAKERKEPKEEQKKDPKKKLRRKSDSSSSESPGKAGQKRPRGGSSSSGRVVRSRGGVPRKKAKSPSPGRRRRKKAGSTSSNDSG